MTDLVYILGASHSGSTLLAMLLGAHKGAVAVGELAPGSFGDIRTYRCSCRSVLPECSFWRRVQEEMARRGSDFSLSDFRTSFTGVSGRVAHRLIRPLCRGRATEFVRDLGLSLCPSWRSTYPRWVLNNRALAQVVSELCDGRAVVDSSKTGLRLKYLLRIRELRVRVIWLVRDGRAVTLTYMDPAEFADASNPALRGGGMGGDRSREELPVAAAAREWRRSNEEAEAVLSGLGPEQWIRVRYEDLCTDTGAQLRRIFTFLGLDPAQSSRDFRSVEHHVLGNGMRLDDTSEIRLDDRWRTALTPAHLEVFDSVAGEMSRRLGYD